MNLDQMARRCPGAKVIGTVRLDGYRLTFAGGGCDGVATILPDADSHVDGVLWDIRKGDEKSLDYYEGFPNLYGKETVTVKDQAGNMQEAMAYTMNAPYRDAPAAPSAYYLNGIVTGCRQNKISPQPVYAAFERICKETEARQMHRTPRRRWQQR